LESLWFPAAVSSMTQRVVRSMSAFVSAKEILLCGSPVKGCRRCHEDLKIDDRTLLVWKDNSPDEDRELVTLCQRGDQDAFEALVRKYQQTVLNLVYHYIGHRNETEDVAQKIFVKIYFSLGKFDTHRPFLPWLYRIAINQCYDELRRIRRQKVYTFSELTQEETRNIENLISQNPNPQASHEARQDMHALLYRMLNQLPDKQRLSIVLRDLEALTYAEMARILGCSEQAARLKVFRARARLKKLMGKAIDPET
jgi:RNA polymerase sigma-70 factor (ECF subfamily)